MTRWIVMALGCSSALSDNQIAINFHLIKKNPFLRRCRVALSGSEGNPTSWRREIKWYTTRNKRRKKLWLRWNVKKNSFAPRIEIFYYYFLYLTPMDVERERRALSRPSQFLFWNMILLRYAIANWKNTTTAVRSLCRRWTTMSGETEITCNLIYSSYWPIKCWWHFFFLFWLFSSSLQIVLLWSMCDVYVSHQRRNDEWAERKKLTWRNCETAVVEIFDYKVEDVAWPHVTSETVVKFIAILDAVLGSSQKRSETSGVRESQEEKCVCLCVGWHRTEKRLERLLQCHS